MENTIKNDKLFEVLDPCMYSVIRLALRDRLDLCSKRVFERLEANGGNADDVVVRYWLKEFEKVSYTYNRLP